MMPQTLVPPPVTISFDNPTLFSAAEPPAQMLEHKSRTIWYSHSPTAREEELYSALPPQTVGRVFEKALEDRGIQWTASRRNEILALALAILTAQNNTEFGLYGLLYVFCYAGVLSAVMISEVYDVDGTSKVVDRKMSESFALNVLRTYWPTYKSGMPSGTEFESWHWAVPGPDINPIQAAFQTMAQTLTDCVVKPMMERMIRHVTYDLLRNKKLFGELASALWGDQLIAELDRYKESGALVHMLVGKQNGDLPQWPTDNDGVTHPSTSAFLACLSRFQDCPDNYSLRHWCSGPVISTLSSNLSGISHALSFEEGGSIITPFDGKICPIQDGPTSLNSADTPYPGIEATLVMPIVILNLVFDLIKDYKRVPQVNKWHGSDQWLEANLFTLDGLGSNKYIDRCYRYRDKAFRDICAWMDEDQNFQEMCELETYLALNWVTCTGTISELGEKILGEKAPDANAPSTSTNITQSPRAEYDRKVKNAVCARFDPLKLVSADSASWLFKH